MTVEEKKKLKEEIKKELFEESIEIEKIRDIELPSYVHFGDAGMDVRSAIDIDIKPGETVLIPLGFKLNIPIGYEIDIRPRSGISLKTPLRISNSPGVIDAGYKGELCVIMHNSSITNDGIFTLDEKNNSQGIYHINKKERIAQIVLYRYVTIKFNEVTHLSEENDRGGGFGHSGVN